MRMKKSASGRLPFHAQLYVGWSIRKPRSAHLLVNPPPETLPDYGLMIHSKVGIPAGYRWGYNPFTPGRLNDATRRHEVC